VFKANFDKDPEGDVCGYVAGFRLNDGFEKVLYWTKDKVVKHAKRYSKAFGDGPWQNQFDDMARKTVLKQVLKYGPMSTELADALRKDQAVIERDFETGEERVKYVDNPETKDV
jgi:recombination protein RecT